MLYRTFLGFGLVAACAAASADTLWMKNGDRLSGRVTLLDGGKLLIETPYGGAVAVKWTDVATLDADHELVVRRPGEAEPQVYTLRAAEPGRVELVGAAGSQVESLAAIEQIVRPKPLVHDLRWKGNIDVGVDYQRGESESDDYSAQASTRASHGLWRHSASGSFEREHNDGETIADNWEADYALDRFLDEHWFWQNRVNYRRDRIEDVREERTLGSGPGYQFWDDELGAFSLASLVNHSVFRFEDGERSDFQQLTLNWDYNRYLRSKTFELYSAGEVGKPLSNVAEYTFDGTLGLRYKVTDWASMNMRAEKDIVSGAEGELDETSYHLGFGVGW